MLSHRHIIYKSHNTAKDHVGIAPSGIVTFISVLYERGEEGGHISDKKITQECGFIHLESGDGVMANRSFDIQHLLASKYLPPFFGEEKRSCHMKRKLETISIASVLINVERAIEQVKNYRILKGVIPISLHAQLEMKFGYL